jgi:hypothetical protein
VLFLTGLLNLASLEKETPKDKSGVTFTVAVDLQVAGLSTILRLQSTVKAKIYKRGERFYKLKMKGLAGDNSRGTRSWQHPPQELPLRISSGGLCLAVVPLYRSCNL